VLSDIIAPGRLRDGDPQALAALLAVGGWAVVSYCERASAGDDVASAVLLTFVTFRRRAIQAGDEAAAEFERILLQSARDAVDEVRGDAPAPDESRAAQDAFVRASPRPLSARLATEALRALVDAAPVSGEPSAVYEAAERSYAEAYEAGEAAPMVSGEERLWPASPLLAQAANGHDAVEAPPPQVVVAPAPRPSPTPARLRRLAPVSVAAGAAVLVVLLVVLMVVLTGNDKAPRRTAATPRVATVVVPPASARQVIRGAPRQPMTASGVRFAIAPIKHASWAERIRARPPRFRHHWVTIALRVRNLSRPYLVLGGLGYRLQTQAGVIIGPRVIDLSARPERPSTGRLVMGARRSVHLGFEVPAGAGKLTFAFDPGGLNEPKVLVALGRTP
jgi:hypothetical protein